MVGPVSCGISCAGVFWLGSCIIRNDTGCESRGPWWTRLRWSILRSTPVSKCEPCVRQRDDSQTLQCFQQSVKQILSWLIFCLCLGRCEKRSGRDTDISGVSDVTSRNEQLQRHLAPDPPSTSQPQNVMSLHPNRQKSRCSPPASRMPQ